MPNAHESRLDSVEAGAPATDIEVTPEMIEAGADMLCDGSELGDMFSPSTALYFSEKVIRAALEISLRGKVHRS